MTSADGKAPGSRMQRGWESEALNWATFARTPGYDRAHENVNTPALLDLLPAPGRRTLDLACGEGRLSRLLQSLGHEIVGVDAAPTMVALAAGHASPAPAVLADAGKLPFPDGSFDLVLAYMCLHDIDDMPGAVAEAARVLLPSGRLCIAIPHPINTAGSFAGREPDAPFVISGSYLDSTAIQMTVSREDAQLTFYSEHRPLQAYAEALEAAGFLTETIREIRSAAKIADGDPARLRWQRIPLFLHLLAVKAG